MLRRVVETLGATVKVEIEYNKSPESFRLGEKKNLFRVKNRN